MTAARPLAGRTLLMSGGSRGIGLAMGVAAGRLGANVVLLAKTDTPAPRLPGTVHTAAQAIQDAGGQALAVVGDVREEADVQRAVDEAVARFGGIDFCVNNASALAPLKTEELPLKRFDLMQQVQLRGTFLLTRAALPHLRRAPRPHILSLSPPINLAPRWMGLHPAYTMAKYGMTLLTLGWAAEFAEAGIAANTLWPRTLIATVAVQNLLGGDASMQRARAPDIMADAAVALLQRSPRDCTGQSFIDEDVLRAEGISDFSGYGGGPDVLLDLYVDP
ncbi:SDR family oxidoreductase [Corallococcus macrosporus]|uniref:Short chain dehydrogenase n=1 Tax=Corallococcus macrosporus DSM 14697 TaxID=1189310 RepID=A0A250K4R5_9BACT|nr:NAD(P)-dependent oxidoreductase [Corallococcus macrosporus]ATB51035.1 short chain dehydrogenase [Corallococcus macrosporus DSM 14697]